MTTLFFSKKIVRWKSGLSNSQRAGGLIPAPSESVVVSLGKKLHRRGLVGLWVDVRWWPEGQFGPDQLRRWGQFAVCSLFSPQWRMEISLELIDIPVDQCILYLIKNIEFEFKYVLSWSPSVIFPVHFEPGALTAWHKKSSNWDVKAVFLQEVAKTDGRGLHSETPYNAAAGQRETRKFRLDSGANELCLATWTRRGFIFFSCQAESSSSPELWRLVLRCWPPRHGGTWRCELKGSLGLC